MIIAAKLDVTKILKEKLFKGERGTYLDITLLENREGPDQYGNDFMVVQDIGKEARERGEKGPILGNAKIRVGAKPAPKPEAARPSGYSLPAGVPKPVLGEDVPF